MRHVYLLLLTAFLCPCCIQNKTDWKAMYDSLNDDFAEYGRTYSDEIYDRIISKCDLMIESSPEFCNAALKLVELYKNRSPKIVRLFKTAHKELVDEWRE